MLAKNEEIVYKTSEQQIKMLNIRLYWPDYKIANKLTKF